VRIFWNNRRQSLLLLLPLAALCWLLSLACWLLAECMPCAACMAMQLQQLLNFCLPFVFILKAAAVVASFFIFEAG